MNLVDKIEEKIKQNIDLTHISIIDESADHAGHAGAKSGAHLAIFVVSDQMTGLNDIARHRLIYKILKDEMSTVIHALRIEAYTNAAYQLLPNKKGTMPHANT